MAVLLVRAGVRTTLLCRTVEQVNELAAGRHNERYLPGVELPRDLKIRTLGTRDDQFSRPDLVFLAVPSKGIGEALEQLRELEALAEGIPEVEGPRRPRAPVPDQGWGGQAAGCVLRLVARGLPR